MSVLNILLSFILQSAIFNFQSLLTVILLLICTCAYIRALAPSLLDKNKTGYDQILNHDPATDVFPVIYGPLKYLFLSLCMGHTVIPNCITKSLQCYCTHHLQHAVLHPSALQHTIEPKPVHPSCLYFRITICS